MDTDSWADTNIWPILDDMMEYVWQAWVQEDFLPTLYTLAIYSQMPRVAPWA